jgi:hypothetical protein
MTETIKHLVLKEATLEEALQIIGHEWEQRRLGESLPVAISDFDPPEGPRSGYTARITLDLKNIPFIEALRYVAAMSDRQFNPKNGLVQLEGYPFSRMEDWSMRTHDVSPKALAKINREGGPAPVDVRRFFQNLGVKLEDWMKVVLIDEGRRIVVLSADPQQEQIAGILHLLGEGFTISR